VAIHWTIWIRGCRLPDGTTGEADRRYDDPGKASSSASAQLFSPPESRLLDKVEGLVDISAFPEHDPFCHLVEEHGRAAALRQIGQGFAA